MFKKRNKEEFFKRIFSTKMEKWEKSKLFWQKISFKCYLDILTTKERERETIIENKWYGIMVLKIRIVQWVGEYMTIW